MSTWFTCNKCSKRFEYRDRGVAAVIEQSLDGNPFVCDRCGGTVGHLADTVVTVPYDMRMQLPADPERRARNISEPIA